MALVAAAAVVLAMMGWLVAQGGEPGPPQFEVRDQRTGEVYYTRSAMVGETFDLEHTHSITRRLVVETFSIADEETIAIEQMWFDMPGPNLPTGPEPLGDGETTFLHEDGAYRVIHHGFPLGTVPVLVGGEFVDHALVFDGGERVRLLDIAGSGAAVEFAVRAG